MLCCWHGQQISIKSRSIQHYVKHILKYLRRTRDYMLVYQSEDLTAIGYTNSNFQSDRDSRKSTSGYVFTLGGGAIS